MSVLCGMSRDGQKVTQGFISWKNQEVNAKEIVLMLNCSLCNVFA